jgi:flagellar hook capping protein FlgD
MTPARTTFLTTGRCTRRSYIDSACVARQLRTILVLLLLAGTAAAFVVTEDLKLEPDPIARPRITPTFSPICRCEKQSAQIAFRLRQSDRLTLTIEDAQGRVVRTLLRNASFGRGNHTFGWDGRDDSGEVVDEGAYRPTIELQKLDRTIAFPRTIRVDTTPARIEITRFTPRTISPDGDGRADALTIRYETNEPAQAILLVNGRQEIETALGKNAIRWSPKGQKRGPYSVSVAAVDAAGNRSRETGPFDVRIRYVNIAAEVIRARPRAGFSIQVSTDAKRYRWRLGRREGSARVRILRLRAPAAPGRYALVVEVGGRRDSAVVVVRRR